jgi:hypothetical protein
MLTQFEYVQWIEIIASLSVTGALITTLYIHKQTKKSTQFKLSEKFSDKLDNLHEELRKIPPEKENTKEYESQINSWNVKLFNTLEWFSFMVNEKQITDYKMINFFGKTIARYYDRIFKVVSSDILLKEDDYFPELKRLYKDFKNGKYDDSTLCYKIRRKLTLG